MTFHARGYARWNLDSIELDGVNSATLRITLESAAYLAGILVDSETGAGIAGAKVTIGSDNGNNSAVTDAEGRFKVTGLGDKLSMFSANADGYTSILSFSYEESFAAQFEGCLNTDRAVIKLGRTGKLLGKVIPPAGAAMPGTFGYYTTGEKGGGGITSSTLSPDGTFSTVLAAQVLAATVNVSGYAPCVICNIEIKPGKTTEVEFRLDSGCKLAGIVKDAETGKPIESVSIKASGIFCREIDSITGPGGAYEMGLLPVCGIDLWFSVDGYAGRAERVEFSATGQIQRIDVTLNRAGNLTGVVVNEKGDRIAGAYVRLVVDGESDYAAMVDEAGQFIFTNILPGKYGILVNGAYCMDVEIRKSETARVTVKAQPR